MRPFHRRLASLGLDAVERFGFVLAGGYALSANGLGDRPSADVDLFTNVNDPAAFAIAAGRLVAVLEADGLTLSVNRRVPTFFDAHVVDEATGEASDLQLGVNFRGYEPAQLTIGPTLALPDAVAGKMSALWSRGEVRDFIDIDTVLREGAMTSDDVLRIGDSMESLPMDRRMLAERFRGIAMVPQRQFDVYAVDAARRAEIVERFARWADEIDPDRS